MATQVKCLPIFTTKLHHNVLACSLQWSIVINAFYVLTVLKIISVTDHQTEIDKICDNSMDMKVTWAFLQIMSRARFANYGKTHLIKMSLFVFVLILHNNRFNWHAPLNAV